MPIRFRCRHCNQLMGISRRKAGTTVHCPTCHGQVMVPPPAEGEAADPRPPEPPQAPAPFEGSDFDAFLDNPVNEAPRPALPPAAPPEPSPYHAERLNPPSLSFAPSARPARPMGLVLSPTQATWLTVVAILLLALAFGAGLLVGHYWMG